MSNPLLVPSPCTASRSFSRLCLSPRPTARRSSGPARRQASGLKLGSLHRNRMITEGQLSLACLCQHHSQDCCSACQATYGDDPPPSRPSVTFAAGDDVSSADQAAGQVSAGDVSGGSSTVRVGPGKAAVAGPGDAILFDYRILHRGLANTSASPRPLAYFTYARSW